MARLSLHQIRHRLAKLPEGFHRQYGLRKVGEAITLVGKNDGRVDECRHFAEAALRDGQALAEVRR